METLVDHFESFQGLYIVLTVVLALIGGFPWFDVSTARRSRGKVGQRTGPGHTGKAHTHHPWAGMNESGPNLP